MVGVMLSAIHAPTISLMNGITCMAITIYEYAQYTLYAIVACQRGGVSNKPPWASGSDKTRGQGSFGPFTGGRSLVRSQVDVHSYL